MSGLRNIPQLTGIRAFACSMVILLHAGAPGFLLWSGVDLFFVLSGFLITGVLLSQPKGENYFRIFYTRRFLRIFPAFYAILILSALVLQQNCGSQVFCTSIFMANIYMPFADSSAPTCRFALGPYWSLSVEEQFYLLWPLIVFILNPKQLIWVCVAMIAAAPIFRGLTFSYIFQPSSGNDLSIWMLPWNRMDLLAAGAAIAICKHRELFSVAMMVRFGAWLCLGCATILAIAAVTIPHDHLTAHSLLFSVLGFSIVCGMMSGLILYLANSTEGWIVRFLSIKPLVYIGTVSYSMYLVHATVIVLSKRIGIMEGNWRLPLVAWFVSLLISAVSWHFFELPINRLKDRLVWTKKNRFAADASTSN